ncbi:hypothetical protein [Klebsiella huaxiensis]|uniref:Uncharacterized protein n=1 Tax=Klebsiella huaxiensis TaxID=2153354 RepID=A0ABT6ECU0_9ENTR|nr:hypothetical protein [Klebsiella huaxiensis]MDG1643010.1 hypothetical protein [Klebsiella huaxiensis]
MGVAIMSAGTDASAYANNYIPPVSGTLAWANLESDVLPSARRLKNFGSLGGSFALSGVAQLVAKGVAAAAGTESRLTLGNFTPDAYTLIALVDVGASAGIIRHRNIRIMTDANKKIQRVMDAGTSVSTIAAPATGSFVVFLNGDLTGHSFGMATSTGVQKVDSTAVNTTTTDTFIGGSWSNGTAAAWKAYGAAFYDRKLSDSELIQVAERLIKRAKYLGVTVNG